MRRFLGALLLIAAAVTVTSCADNPTVPTVPDAVLVTETFDGSLTTSGSVYHLFTARAGRVNVTLQGIENPSIKLGMQIGAFTTFGCESGLDNSAATIGSRLEGVASSLTSMCVKMYDPGSIPLATAVAYRLTVTHY